MDESTRQKLIDSYTQQAKNQDARVAWRVQGHAFAMGSRGAACLGCGMTVSGWSPSSTPVRVTAEKASRALPPCEQPWNLENRLRKIAEKYARTGQSGEEGGEVTLESVNAKLDRIIKHFRIK